MAPERSIPRRLTAAIAFAAMFGSLSCFSEGTPVSTAQGGGCQIRDFAALAGAGRAVVVIKDFAFAPATLRVRPGTTVVWLNCDEQADPHTATADNAAFDSGTLPYGAVYTRRLDAAGTFPYHCIPHPFMKATVVVDPAAT